jgi:acetyl esterase/lipase
MLAADLNPGLPMQARRLSGILIAASLLLSTAPLAAANYPPVAGNVSFDAVLALPASKPVGTIRYGDAETQFAELWLPEGEAPAPTVVFIHGGCWLNAYGIDHSRALATALTWAGYAVWNVEYRRVGDPGGGWPGSFEDVQAALATLAALNNARLDLSRLVFAGHSAGGHLALLAGQDPSAGLSPLGVIGLAAITDMATYAEREGGCNQAGKQFLGEAGADDDAADPSARPAPPGTLLLMGTEDRIVPYELPSLKPHTLVGLPAGHFDWIYPGTTAWDRFVLELARVMGE